MDTPAANRYGHGLPGFYPILKRQAFKRFQDGVRDIRDGRLVELLLYKGYFRILN
jgi:hypothetical protein